ncbi:MAG: DUF2442 domain-containing protein [Candidatus Sericytochromatia bacterium]|nr:DUF2442 domain-containing protein [Candidatus Tanganyikabacteria bacterium]
MRSAQPGRSTSDVEVTNISKYGFWVIIHDKELFLPFEDFPWFREATVGQILNLDHVTEGHLHWPDLDVDLDVESIEHPERFPLVSKASIVK